MKEAGRERVQTLFLFQTAGNQIEAKKVNLKNKECLELMIRN